MQVEFAYKTILVYFLCGRIFHCWVSFLNVYGTIWVSLFWWILVIYIFLGICAFHLTFLIYWHKWLIRIILNICYICIYKTLFLILFIFTFSLFVLINLAKELSHTDLFENSTLGFVDFSRFHCIFYFLFCYFFSYICFFFYLYFGLWQVLPPTARLIFNVN